MPWVFQLLGHVVAKATKVVIKTTIILWGGEGLFIQIESPIKIRDREQEICLAEPHEINQLLGYVVAEAMEVVIKNHCSIWGGGG